MIIDWNEQAKDFLLDHGWYREKGVWFHPCFPLGQELPEKARKEDNQRGYYTPIQFVSMFYGRAWSSYHDYVQSIDIFNDKKGEEDA